MHLTWIEKFGINQGSEMLHLPSSGDYILLSEENDIINHPFYVFARFRGPDTKVCQPLLWNAETIIKFSLEACSDWNLYRKINLAGDAYIIPGKTMENKRIYRILAGTQSYNETFLSFLCSQKSITTITPLRFGKVREDYPNWTNAPENIKKFSEWDNLKQEYNQICNKINNLLPLANRLWTNIYLIENDTNKDIWKDIMGEKAADNIRLVSFQLVIEASNLCFDKNVTSLSLPNLRERINEFANQIRPHAPKFYTQLSELLDIFPVDKMWNNLFSLVTANWTVDGKSKKLWDMPELKVARDKQRAHTDRGYPRVEGEGIFLENIYPESNEALRGIEIAISIMSLCYWAMFQGEDSLASLPVHDDSGLLYRRHPDIETIWELFDMLPPEKFKLGLK